MNQKVQNEKGFIPKHIDPREAVKHIRSDDIRRMSKMMKESGNTPYRYIRRALRCLAEDDYGTACDWLTYAEKFIGVFYKTNADNDALKITIDALRLQFIFLAERFKELRPETDQRSVV